MSRCFIWFPFGGLGKPKLYHDSRVFYKNRGFYLEGVWLWRIGGGLYIIKPRSLFSAFVSCLLMKDMYPNAKHITSCDLSPLIFHNQTHLHNHIYSFVKSKIEKFGITTTDIASFILKILELLKIVKS